MRAFARSGGSVATIVSFFVGTAWLTIILNSGGVLHSGMVPMGMTRGESHGWMLGANIGFMLVAMMLPLIVSPLRHAYDQSLSNRQWLSVTSFVVGYFALWTPVGFILWFVGSRQPYPLIVCVTLCAGALLWQCSPGKQTCLNQCHRFPNLPPFGPESFGEAVTFGLRHGVWCLASCLPAMAVLISAPMYLLAMLAVSLWLFAERFERPIKPGWAIRFPSRMFRAAWAQAVLTANRLSPPNAVMISIDRANRYD